MLVFLLEFLHQTFQQFLFVGVVEPLEKFLAEVVSILMHQKLSESIGLTYARNDKVDKLLDF